jgi:POT family proton-dependent oligopeptide transporter
MIPLVIPFKIPWLLPDGIKIDAAAMQAVNPLMVMTLVPFLTLVCYPVLGRLASPLKRMSAGFFLAGFSFLVVAGLQTRVDAGAQMSILWQMLPYLILTTAEVLISTTGLEFAFREAAPSMKSTIMGFWNLSVAMGNLLVMGITKVLATDSGAGSVTPGRFVLYAGLTFGAAVLFTLITLGYKYRDETAAQGK